MLLGLKPRGSVWPRDRPRAATAKYGRPMTDIASIPLTTLGSSGIAVSPLCLGGNVFGWTVDEPTSHAILDAYVAGGGNFIDTADIYSTWVAGHSGGESERIIGRWRAGLPASHDLVVATKVGMEMPAGSGLASAYMIAAAERSRERLGVEVIDLLYAHRPDPATPVADTMHAFDELIRSGTIRAFGLSNYDANQLRAAIQACEAHGLARPVVVQPEYNLVDRTEFEGPMQDICVSEGIAAAPYYALAAGFLTGKYRPGSPTPATPRGEGVLRRYGTPAGWALIEALDAVASRHEATVAQIALAWLAAQPGVVAPIASGTSPGHVAELLGATQITLEQRDLDELG